MSKKDLKSIMIIIAVLAVVAILVVILCSILYLNSHKQEIYNSGYLNGKKEGEVERNNSQTALFQAQQEVNKSSKLFEECNSSYQKCQEDKLSKSNVYSIFGITRTYSTQDIEIILNVLALFIPITLAFSLIKIKVKIAGKLFSQY